ncbi:MAG: hypothetical protein VX223_09325, partial [Myxococcota bacterium]|nr:hypothetical protein [Myxococcota bacterium]
MKVRLENFVPYDQSLQWTLHADYFKAKGRSAWTDNIIPYAATNNAPLARQHIHILFRLIKELEEAEKIDASEGIAILEVGAGSGQFSIQIFEALAHDFGDAGRRLRERITWFLSDFSEKTLQEATESKHVASLVAEGRVVPALYDASGREPMRRLDGQTLQGQVIAVVASYLGCVLPFRYFRKQDNHWTECWASLSAEIEGNDLDAQTVLDSIRGGITSPVWSQLSLELDWRPVTLEDAFDDPTHARVINDATEAMDESTVGYPTVLFDALVRWKKLLVDGGLVFLSDLGKHSSLSLAGHEDPNPTIYGNTLNHSVCFALLEPLARHSNFGLLRTVDALGQLQQAICKHGPPLSQGLEDTFRTWYVESTEHQDLLDFEKAGRDAYENSDYRRSMRLYRKCLALSPRDPDLYYGLGR